MDEINLFSFIFTYKIFNQGTYQMTSKLKEDTSFVLNVVKLASIVIACIAAVTFFIYQTNGLPPRVSKLETDMMKTNQKISEMQAEMGKNSAKTDIILEDVKIIKNAIVNKAYNK